MSNCNCSIVLTWLTAPDMTAQIRLATARDLAWALATSPSFLFNR